MIWAILLLVLIIGPIMLVLMSPNKALAPGRAHVGTLDRQMVADRWQTISAQAESGGNGLRQAVMEADKLLDYAMRQAGFPGETMGERLKSSRSSRFSDVNAIWRAHKLRNTFAHEVGADLVVSQAKEALSDFELGLKDLGAL